MTEQDLLDEALIGGKSIEWLRRESERLIVEIVELEMDQSEDPLAILAKAKDMLKRLSDLEGRLALEEKAAAKWRLKYAQFIAQKTKGQRK